jgi:peptidoglycan/xylan/chitin deacetylase (PgdA/CDA1 family)
MIEVIIGGGAVLAATAATAVTAYGMIIPKSTLLAPSIWRGPEDRAAIALTFDDGPSESTASILEILQRYRITATFFQCGVNVERLPQVAREVKAAGHELGNHTDTHPHLCFKSPGFIYGELARAQEKIQRATGVTPSLFRAPFGLRWYGLRRAQRRLGLTGVMWTGIGSDWIKPPEHVIERLRFRATNGAILCLHDGRRTNANPDISTTVKALKGIIPILLDDGFHFESVMQMMLRKNTPSAGTASTQVSAHS